jgi:DNA-binding transcriptional LysR family regulator
MIEPDWNLYRSCLAVLQTGSLSGAARVIGSSQPSIGRHIATLEAQLGQPLFTRSPTGLLPTALALSLQPAMQAMATAALKMQRAAEGHGSAGQTSLRLTASQIIGGEVLPAILARFRARHPHITLELSLNNRNEDLLQGEADLAVRMARPTQQALVSRSLGRVEMGLFAHRSYLQRAGTPASLADLSQHTLIGADQDPTIARLGVQLGVNLSREMFQFRCDSDLAQMNATRAGLGVGGLQWGLARRDPNLVPVLPDQVKFGLDMWLVMHGDLRRQTSAKALFMHLANELGAYAASSQAPA